MTVVVYEEVVGGQPIKRAVLDPPTTSADLPPLAGGKHLNRGRRHQSQLPAKTLARIKPWAA